MKRKNLIKVSLASCAAAMCTLFAGFGVWAASQNTLTATENVAFVADALVDATVASKKGTTTGTTYTFTSKVNSDDTQNGAFVNIVKCADGCDHSACDWKYNTATADNDQDRVATFTITIANTSTQTTNTLNYKVESNFASEYCTIDIKDTEGAIEKGASKDIVVTYVADGIHDFDVNSNWKVTLTASR